MRAKNKGASTASKAGGKGGRERESCARQICARLACREIAVHALDRCAARIWPLVPADSLLHQVCGAPPLGRRPTSRRIRLARQSISSCQQEAVERQARQQGGPLPCGSLRRVGGPPPLGRRLLLAQRAGGELVKAGQEGGEGHRVAPVGVHELHVWVRSKRRGEWQSPRQVRKARKGAA